MPESPALTVVDTTPAKVTGTQQWLTCYADGRVVAWVHRRKAQGAATGAVVELDEWRVVDNANRTVQTYETETAATGQPTSVFLATLDKRLPDRAPHRVMRVCLTEVDV